MVWPNSQAIQKREKMKALSYAMNIKAQVSRQKPLKQ